MSTDALRAGFDDFLAQLGSAAAAVDAAPLPDDPQLLAEGYRQIGHHLRTALEWEASDPAHPHLFRVLVPPAGTKGLDNPDNLHHMARVSPDHDYVLYGRRGSSADLSFQTIAGLHGDGAVARSVAFIDLDSLQVDDDNSFEITLSSRPQPGNWLELDAETDNLLIRQTFADWASETPTTVHLARSGQAAPPPPVTADIVADRYREVGRIVSAIMEFWPRYVGMVSEAIVANTVAPVGPTGSGGVPSQYQAMGRFELDPDQALVVQVAPSDARYQGFQLGSPFFESLEYVSRQTSLNTAQAHLGSDSSYHFVVCGRDPGVPNWLDTEEHRHGLLLLRWQGVGIPPPPDAVEVNLTDIDAARDLLPADEPVVTPEQRQSALNERARLANRRFGR